MIGGNVTATVQIKSTVGKNAIGEGCESWLNAGTVLGWLDFQSGQNGVQQYNAKIQETTHVFMCDCFRWIFDATSENSRMIVNGEQYNVLMIDNPMGLNKHMEIFLQYVGGGLGGR